MSVAGEQDAVFAANPHVGGVQREPAVELTVTETGHHRPGGAAISGCKSECRIVVVVVPDDPAVLPVGSEKPGVQRECVPM